MENVRPKITVAQATFNCVNVIEESLLSIINQTYKNIEYIIIDGGSTDGTLDLLLRYKDNIDILVSEPDKGIYDAMNKALDKATGDFIIFMGADDHFLSWRTLEKVAHKLTDQQHVFYGQIYYEAYNLLHKGEFNRYKRALYNYCHQSIFYPKNGYKKYQYDLHYKIMADNEYNFRISKEYPFKWIDETVSFYADGGESAQRKDLLWEENKDKIIREHCGVDAWIFSKIYSLLRDLKNIRI